MATVSEILQERLQNALQAIGIAIDEPLQIAPTTDPRHGDYQTNAAMVLGKKLKQNPRNLAGQIVANLSMNDIGTPPEVAGPGFINFRLSPEFLASSSPRTCSGSTPWRGTDGQAENRRHRLQLPEYCEADACRAYPIDDSRGRIGKESPGSWGTT